MGVVNVTPDSFSDGGVHLYPAAAVDRGARDARRGSRDRRRRRRVDPARLGRGAARRGASRGSCRCSRGSPGKPVSIDTAKAEVARRALELGAELVNDVTALRGDPELAGVVAEAGAYCCLMHMRGEPRTMQEDPRYDDVVSEVKAFLEERLAFAVAEGIREELVCLDPGHRVREDRRAQLRAPPPAARAGRDRTARDGRLLAEELAGPDPGRPGGDRRDGCTRRSAPPSRPTSAARRSCACTTSASTSRRSRPRGRCTG